MSAEQDRPSPADQEPSDSAALMDAPHMDFKGYPVSAEAKALVADLLSKLLLSEARKRKRTSAEAAAFERTVSAVVIDLLDNARFLEVRESVKRSNAKGWCRHSLAEASFAGSTDHPYTAFRATIEGLERLALVERKAGFAEASAFIRTGRIWGRQTRFRARSALIALAQVHGVNLGLDKFARHFRFTPPGKALLLRGPSSGYGDNKQSGRPIKFDATELTRSLEAEVREINAYLSKVDIQPFTHRGFTRIFNDGGKADYAWNKGGRLYSIGEGSYQNLPEQQRLTMTFNGEPVVEIDIKSCMPMLTHSALGRLDYNPHEHDPYTLPETPRLIGKLWFTQAIGLNKLPSRWTKGHVKKAAESGLDLGLYPIKKIETSMLAHTSALREWFSQDQLGYLDLMYLESQALVTTMLELVRKEIPCLSVHDSLIVPASKAGFALVAFGNAYYSVCGIMPAMEVEGCDGPIARQSLFSRRDAGASSENIRPADIAKLDASASVESQKPWDF